MGGCAALAGPGRSPEAAPRELAGPAEGRGGGGGRGGEPRRRGRAQAGGAAGSRGGLGAAFPRPRQSVRGDGAGVAGLPQRARAFPRGRARAGLRPAGPLPGGPPRRAGSHPAQPARRLRQLSGRPREAAPPAARGEGSGAAQALSPVQLTGGLRSPVKPTII